ncbi:hypothetical protein AB0N81_30055 [Streptomyces sp. NPDC093510]
MDVLDAVIADRSVATVHGVAVCLLIGLHVGLWSRLAGASVRY